MSEVPNLQKIESKVLTAITFHFRDERMATLALTLRSLALWPVSSMEVVLFVNEIAQENLVKLTNLCAETLKNCDFKITIADNLRDPWQLTWVHKALIRDVFLRKPADYSHFIYLEDDIALNYENFSYWIRGRSALKPFGLLPFFKARVSLLEAS